MALHETFDTRALVVGNAYSRVQMAEAGGVAPPTGPRDPRWSLGLVRFSNVTLLLVTLEKRDGGYDDRFEGEQFHWQSQYRQNRKSEALVDVEDGTATALLFVRIWAKRGKTAEPFYYLGEVSLKSMEGDRPVDCVFDVKESLRGRSRSIDQILRWRPIEPTDELGAALFRAREVAEQETEALNGEDRRGKELRAIFVRRGQRAFRRKLLKAYGERCAVTGCKITELLEAAHISPYRGDHTNKVSNGLLLRADIHTLFDLGLLWVDEGFTVQVAKSARKAPYDTLQGARLAVPGAAADKPNPVALADHARVSAERRQKLRERKASGHPV
ncbi:DUF3427 domain-containing protein [Stenotrophomonas sp. ZAC14D2_NAIMI4_6]|uniref:DUF3427 domain-containing protein n=1 Tax=Stenotrophomonas sp. ZAC14D2_NAIMI4_6 TaxID=2072406 RepID=UPI000D53F627|nr:DUF3427 domain-containing protein [Stenotrophomonas sp. ZAC14D2_NAIMI4_6]AWH20110.1 hypothetical protein C1933_02025 [Stenotrophomonas sp. ZAC14D2_NAIMI4_6]